MTKPAMRPERPHFSSGPCAKPPGFSLTRLEGALLGRNHRSAPGKARIKAAIDLTRDVLEVPRTHHLAIVPASDTGAVELAMWAMLGDRPVQLLVYEGFGREWAKDATRELRLDAEVIEAPFGRLPDLARIRPDRDLVFPWNGTTSGVRVPNADFIAADREGVTICDATSAVFAQALDWSKLDVVTLSWQKALGGEAGHGMLILSERAIARIEATQPSWPTPRIFRLKGDDGRVDRAIFEGATLNTPSMLCVEDWIACLRWAQGAGGLAGLQARADANAAALSDWVAASDWCDFLAVDPLTRSNTSVCLTFADANADGAVLVAKMTGLLEREGVAFDLASHRSAPPGLRVWCGPTVETDDIVALTPWLDWAYAEARRDV